MRAGTDGDRRPAGLAQRVAKCLAILVIKEDRFPPISPLVSPVHATAGSDVSTQPSQTRLDPEFFWLFFRLRMLVVVLASVAVLGCRDPREKNSSVDAQSAFADARWQMVEQQLKAPGRDLRHPGVLRVSAGVQKEISARVQKETAILRH